MSKRPRQRTMSACNERGRYDSLRSASGGRLMAALTLVASMASQGGILAGAFSLSSFDVSRQAARNSRTTHLSVALAPVEEPPQTLPGLFGRDGTKGSSPSIRPKTMTMSSPPNQHNTMFLKSSRVALQPISSLTSDFYDNTKVTLTRKPFKEGLEDALQQPRARGILGFAIHDHVDHVVPSPQKPLPADSSTSLQSSSQQEQQRQKSLRSKVNFETWGGKRLDDDWMTSAHHSSGNNSPILNRSPSSMTAATLNNYYKQNNNIDDAIGIAAWFPWIPTLTQIEALTVRELKHICMERGLKQVGNKAELQERLWDWSRLQQQRRLAIGGNIGSFPSSSGNLVRFQRNGDRTILKKSGNDATASTNDAPPSTSDVNSLGEWARTYNIEPLLKRREKIHKEKREGKAVPEKQRYKVPRRGGPETPTKEYLSKLFAASSSQYSNFEVKEMYAASKAADQAGDRALSKQILHRLKEATPHDARVYRRLCRMEQEEGNVHEARKILQEGIRLHPSNAHLWHGLGQLEAKAGAGQKARNFFLKAIKLDPAFPNPYHALGTFEHSHGQIARAMKIFKKGLEYCPTNHRLHHALGDLYREAKMLDMAERSFRRALEHGPEVSRAFAYTSLAHVAYEQEKVDKCRAWLRKAVSVNDGRHAKGWVALAHFEESEQDVDAARNVCMTALNQYEKHLINRIRKGKLPKSTAINDRDLASMLSEDPTVVKNRMLKEVPPYRSGDHFLKVYRNWARLEERYGDSEVVDEIYRRASVAFPIDWKLTLDWARYHARSGREDRARFLFNEACEKVSTRHGDPYRIYGEFEMALRNYQDARKIFYRGALAMSHSSEGSSGNYGGMAELFHSWGVCEWHLDNLSRAEVLFDHALRLTIPGDEGSKLRSLILYSIARLEYTRGEYHLAQHCICLCLKENNMPGGTSILWDLWAEIAYDMGNESLALHCEDQASEATNKETASKADGLASILALGSPSAAGLSTMKGPSMEAVMRKDPWHRKIFNTERSSSSLCCDLNLLPVL